MNCSRESKNYPISQIIMSVGDSDDLHRADRKYSHLSSASNDDGPNSLSCYSLVDLDLLKGLKRQ